MTPQYLRSLNIVWMQSFWYTVAWGVVALICLLLAYLPFWYIFKYNDHDPLTVAMACTISSVFGMLAVVPLLMVATKAHAYILFT